MRVSAVKREQHGYGLSLSEPGEGVKEKQDRDSIDVGR